MRMTDAMRYYFSGSDDGPAVRRETFPGCAAVPYDPMSPGESVEFDEAYVLASDYDALAEHLQAERKKREAAEKLTQDIVAKHAEKHLGGYRELGARAATAENERDALAARVKELEDELYDANKGARE